MHYLLKNESLNKVQTAVKSKIMTIQAGQDIFPHLLYSELRQAIDSTGYI